MVELLALVSLLLSAVSVGVAMYTVGYQATMRKHLVAVRFRIAALECEQAPEREQRAGDEPV